MSALIRSVEFVGRAMIAALFLWSGVFGILPDIPATAAMIAGYGLPLPMAGAIAALAVEIVVPVALLVPMTAAPAAAVLSLYCLATALLFHPFWDVEAAARFGEQAHFFKDIALSGALAVIALGRVRA